MSGNPTGQAHVMAAATSAIRHLPSFAGASRVCAGPWRDLRSVPVLRWLDESCRQRFLQQADSVQCPAGARLYHQGSDPRGLRVLLTGHVKMSHTTAEGEELILEIQGPGGVPGLAEVVLGQPARATCVALDEVGLLLVPFTRLEVLLQLPAMNAALLREVARELRDAEDDKIELATADAARLTARRIVALARECGVACDDGIEIELHLSQEELGAWAGLSRESVVKALRSFRDQGLVRTGRRMLVVRDLPALVALAGAPVGVPG